MPRSLNPELRTIQFKKCIDCKFIKHRREFAVIATGTIPSRCLACNRTHNKNYKKTIPGLITFMFNKMKYRIRKEPDYKHLILDFSKEDFKQFVLNSKQFKYYFNLWEKNNYSQAFTPSVDRLNSSKGYYLNNIQIVNQRENSSKTKYNSNPKKLSKYVGVIWDKYRNLYSARISFKGKTIYIGRFKNEKMAALKVNEKCKELNIPIKNIRV